MPRVSRGWVRVRLAVHAVVGLNLFLLGWFVGVRPCSPLRFCAFPVLGLVPLRVLSACGLRVSTYRVR